VIVLLVMPNSTVIPSGNLLPPTSATLALFVWRETADLALMLMSMISALTPLVSALKGTSVVQVMMFPHGVKRQLTNLQPKLTPVKVAHLVLTVLAELLKKTVKLATTAPRNLNHLTQALFNQRWAAFVPNNTTVQQVPPNL
jgi:hypothetical protein